ncbi:MAG: hypothetical protein ACOC5J_02750 [Gemmatimonadota bacterium]
MGRVVGVFVVLLLCLGIPASLSPQTVHPADPPGGQESGFLLEQNYPNPFNPETRIPFVLDENLFASGRPVVVTLRVYNVLQQFVATPTALNHPRGEGTPVNELEYPGAGRYEAYWDGRDQAGREVASGVYFLQLVVNGRAQVRKMFVTK